MSRRHCGAGIPPAGAGAIPEGERQTEEWHHGPMGPTVLFSLTGPFENRVSTVLPSKKAPQLRCDAISSVCGETGIRTRDTLLGYTRFPGVPLKPLEHLSGMGLQM